MEEIFISITTRQDYKEQVSEYPPHKPTAVSQFEHHVQEPSLDAAASQFVLTSVGFRRDMTEFERVPKVQSIVDARASCKHTVETIQRGKLYCFIFRNVISDLGDTVRSDLNRSSIRSSESRS